MKFWPLGNRTWISALIVFILIACSGALFAQAPTGHLRGQIVDQTGAVIPGAAVTVKNSSGLVVSANGARHWVGGE